MSAELSGLILGKTSTYNVRMVAVSCPLLRDTANAAEPIKFEVSPWSRMRVAAGGCHTLCVGAGGRVFACGRNKFGRLGVGDIEKRVVPTLVTGLLKTKAVVQVAAGAAHTAWVAADGLVFVCGNGASGRLGVGDTEGRVVPTLVRGHLEGRKVLQVAAGRPHTMCVAGGGPVFALGSNVGGQLGVGDRENRLVPTLLRGELKNKSVLQVAAGGAHTMPVAANGLVFACGFNNNGQLGVGDTGRRVVPTLVTGQLQGKAAVFAAAGEPHTLCTTVGGSPFAWGDNPCGQLGVGDQEERQVPTLVTALQGKQVVHAAASSPHTICTTLGGAVPTWGAGGGGQLGLGNDRPNKLVPTQVRGGLQNKPVVQVAAGNDHSACVAGDGWVCSWGDNGGGQLGAAGIPHSDLPALVRAFDMNAMWW